MYRVVLCCVGVWPRHQWPFQGCFVPCASDSSSSIKVCSVVSCARVITGQLVMYGDDG